MVPSFDGFLKAYRERPKLKVTPEMVIAGERALRSGLQETAGRVFSAMMQGGPVVDLTPRMTETAAQLIFIRPGFNQDRIVTEMLTVMLQESRSGPDWRSAFPEESAVPRAIEILNQSRQYALAIEDNQTSAGGSLIQVGPEYISISEEIVARGREAFDDGLTATAERIWRAAMADKGVDLTPAMKAFGAGAMVASEGHEDDSIVANVISEMLGEAGYRCLFTAGSTSADREENP